MQDGIERRETETNTMEYDGDGASQMLHVVNGHSLSLPLDGAVPGRVLVYADCLHDGPVPAGISGEEMRRVRAQWLAGPAATSFPEILESLRDVDRELENCGRYGEVVLWYEHDLFDQLLLIRLLDFFSRQPHPGRLSLVSIDAYPGIEPFKGMGQLTREQLVPLLSERTPITAGQLDLGARAWSAFRSDTPHALEHLLIDGTLDLPFLAPALRRMLEDYPAIATGLPRTERDILRQLEDGSRSLRDLFVEHQAEELVYYLGDLSFRDRLRDLAAGPAPLIVLKETELESDSPLSHGTAALTDHGRRVLAGEADWLADGMFNRWIGGVHLHRGAMWRRDELIGALQRA